MTTGIQTRQNTVIGLIAGGHFFSHFFFLALPPLFPLIKAETGASYTALGGVIAVYGGCSALSQYPIGILADRFGARDILILGLSLISLCFLVMGLAPAMPLFYGLAIVAGLADGVFHPCDYAVLTATINQKKSGRAFAIHTAGGFAGFAVAPIFMVFVASLFSWQTAILSAGAMGLVAAMALAAGRPLMLSGNAGSPDTRPKQSPFSVLVSIPLLLMFGFYVLSSTANMGLAAHMVSIMIEHTNGSFAALSPVLPAYMWGIAAGILMGGLAADYLQRVALTATFGMILAALLIAIVALFALPLPAALAAFCASGIAYGSTLASRDIAVRSIAPAGAVAASFGFVNSGYGVGSAIGPVLVGWILDHGLPATALLTTAGLMLLAISCTFSALKLNTAKTTDRPGTIRERS
jgi:MFS family permease